jgi:hypothetical protein
MWAVSQRVTTPVFAVDHKESVQLCSCRSNTERLPKAGIVFHLIGITPDHRAPLCGSRQNRD